MNNKVSFIYVVGVEGCGHHGLSLIIENAIKNFKETSGEKVIVYRYLPKLRDIFCEFWYSTDYTPFDVKRDIIKEIFKESFHKKLETECKYFILEDNSFPSELRRGLDKQWDLEEMTELLRPYAKIHYLVLYRDPIAMTFSHKEYDGGLRNHALVVADFLEYLDSKLANLGSEVFRVINYKDLIDKQKALGPALAGFLGLPLKDIQEGFKYIRRSKKDWRIQMPDDDKKWMLNFFTPNKSSKWPIFINSKYNIFNCKI